MKALKQFKHEKRYYMLYEVIDLSISIQILKSAEFDWNSNSIII